MDQTRRSEQLDAGTTDLDLLRQCASGDGRALRLLFQRHQRALAEYLYRLLGNREDAEEAVADVFLKAWRGAAAFQGNASVRNWLYRIAMHTAIDRLRRRRRTPVAHTSLSDLSERDARLLSDAEDEPEAAFWGAYARGRDRRALRQALQRLRPEDRALLALHYFEECSYEQIGEITGYPLERIRSRLYRARQRLKRHFITLRDADENLEPLAEAVGDPSRDPKRLLAF
jgi:RNA polymerase sigma-70 factor (ECF subfamily)